MPAVHGALDAQVQEGQERDKVADEIGAQQEITVLYQLGQVQVHIGPLFSFFSFFFCGLILVVVVVVVVGDGDEIGSAALAEEEVAHDVLHQRGEASSEVNGGPRHSRSMQAAQEASRVLVEHGRVNVLNEVRGQDMGRVEVSDGSPPGPVGRCESGIVGAVEEASGGLGGWPASEDLVVGLEDVACRVGGGDDDGWGGAKAEEKDGAVMMGEALEGAMRRRGSEEMEEVANDG